MSLVAIISLFAIMLFLAAIPSASVALVVARSALHGLANGAAVTAGIVLADLLFATLAIMGMAFLAESLGGFFAIFRYLGAGYLIWLGLGLLRFDGALKIKDPSGRSSSLAAGFLAGFFLTLGDIKAILFYASLFPAFVDPGALGAGAIASILAITAVTVGGTKLVYAFAGRVIADRLQNRIRHKWLRRSAGGLMIGSGAYIIAKT